MTSDWKQISPGVFSANLDGVQKIYRTASQAFKTVGHEHWGLYAACKLELGLSFSDNDETHTLALRNAWIALRFEFPGLAVIPEGLTKQTYTVPDVTSVEKWARETFFVAKAPSNTDSILAAYPLRDLPALYYFPETSSILLLVSHWRIDGIGTCMLLERLVNILVAGVKATPPESWRLDLHRLSPGTQDALGAPEKVTPQLERLARQYIEDHHKNAVNAAGLPYHGDASTLPGKPRCTAAVITQASTTALMASCKLRGITVTAAVHAALAEVVLDLSPSCQDNFAAVVSVNMRNHLKPPYNRPEHAVQVYVTGVTPSVDRDSSFEDKAYHLTAFYKGWYSEQFVRAFRLTTQYHAEALSKPRPQQAEPSSSPSSSVTLSSLGVIEKYLTGQHGEGDGSVRVADFQFGVSMMTRQMLLYVWTFRGRLNLSVNYNDAYHDAESATGFLEAIRKVLSKELCELREEHTKIR